MKKAIITKERMINEVLMAVNANAERTKNTFFATKKSDGDLFFSLAFMDDRDLLKLCVEIGIKF